MTKILKYYKNAKGNRMIFYLAHFSSDKLSEIAAEMTFYDFAFYLNM